MFTGDYIAIEQLALSDFSLRAIQLLLVIILDRYLTIPNQFHPSVFFKYLAYQLANKVNKRSISQQKIAGLCSWLLLTGLVLTASWIVLFFSLSSWFFELVILWLMLSSRSLLSQAQLIKKNLGLGHKNLAREQLSHICLRDTAQLSSLGIIKATLEALPQRLISSYFSPLLVFGCFGIYPAVFTVVCSSLAQQWSPKRKQFEHFGRLSMAISSLLSLPAKYLFSLTLWLLFTKKISLKTPRQQAKEWHNWGSGFVLSIYSNVLNIELGGAVIYDSIKIRRPSIGTSQPASIEKIDDSLLVIRKVQTLWTAILILALVTSITLTTLT